MCRRYVLQLSIWFGFFVHVKIEIANDFFKVAGIPTIKKRKEEKSCSSSSSHEKSESFVGSNSFRERSPKKSRCGDQGIFGFSFRDGSFSTLPRD